MKVADDVRARFSPSVTDKADDFFEVSKVAGVFDVLFEGEVVNLPSV